MKVFLDFEASSLGKTSYPIEVGWVFENGEAETHLLRPPAAWTDWDAKAEAVHGIPRSTLVDAGEPVEEIAARMMAQLTGHDLFASAPSWDGKWLSTLLRAGGQPRHGLRLRDCEEAQRETAAEILSEGISHHGLGRVIEEIVSRCEAERQLRPAAHRALADAQAELRQWLAVGAMARSEIERQHRQVPTDIPS